jgi:hypothetical protein
MMSVILLCSKKGESCCSVLFMVLHF